MTAKGESPPPAPAPVDGALVTRSTVPPGLKYSEYRQTLRHDFIYSCAYCTMSEAEAQAIRFVIDHYEPRNARPDLIDDYENLMYSCDECNDRKGTGALPLKREPRGIGSFGQTETGIRIIFERMAFSLKHKVIRGIIRLRP
jgi:hypothetical protein